MMMLTRAFQKTLITKAHSLKPVVQIGSNGLTESIHNEIDSQLTKHELIKIKSNHNDRQALNEALDILPKRHQAELIQTIGKILVLYRKSEDKT